MHILVTGGFGFIGENIVKGLLQEGHNVRVLDKQRLLPIVDTWINAIKGNNSIEVMLGDIQDRAVCRNACAGIDVVYHVAGVASIPFSFQEPELTYKVNVTATENLLKACIGADVKKFIYASSGKVYGNLEDIDFCESSKVDPTTPYSKSKVEAEKLCQRYAELTSMKVVALRYFSVYGPRLRLFDGLVGDVVGLALQGGVLNIHAQQNMQRDFSYIDDIVAANLLCLDYEPEQFEIFNIASGKRASFIELLELVEQQVGKKLEVYYRKLLEGTTISTCADITKARKLLGYEPKVDLKSGLQKTISWFQQDSENDHAEETKKKVTAVILTGGSGTRVNNVEPKQFIEIAGKAIFVHCILKYESIKEVDAICLVINAKHQSRYEKILSGLNLTKPITMVPGGTYRHQSISNAMKSLEEGIVVIQNGASPVTSTKLITQCIKEARKNGAVTAYVPAVHTVFTKNKMQINDVIERQDIGYTCDPQAFDTNVLAAAITYSEKLNCAKDMPTVDLVNKLGTPVRMVESASDNIKLTTKSDIKAIEHVLTTNN